jgi:hypothetical protein
VSRSDRRRADPLELLRRHNPVDLRTLPGTDDTDVEMAFVRILAGTPPTASPRRRFLHRRTALLLPAALALVAATTAVLLTRDVSEPAAVGCYRDASTDADLIVAATGNDVSAVETCRQLWQEGAFGAAPPPPELTECVLPSGVVAVYPASDCSAVSQPAETSQPTASAIPGTALEQPLPPTSQEHSATASQIETARDRLLARLLEHECPSVEQAAELVTEVLDQGLLPGWDLEVAAGFQPSRPCASLYFDEVRKRIELVPLGR